MSNSSLIQHWQGVQANLDDHIKLIAVSKRASDTQVETLMQAGQQDFAEARPQNLRDRAHKFPLASWHMIGPLQKNKAKYVGRFACMWHSLCDLETAQAVAHHVTHRILPVLVQVNISGESQKQGIMPEALPTLLQQLADIPTLKVIGLMGMAAKDTHPRQAFAKLRQNRDGIKDDYPQVQALCMGMSNDWRIAVEEGATMIRVGSEIFGSD